MSNFKSILIESMKAYSDVHSENRDHRTLDFKATLPVTGEEFIRILNQCAPNGYNEFNSIVAENVRAVFGNDAEYTIARENSVCVYIKPKAGVKFNGERYTNGVSLKALNVDEVTYEGDGIFRLWWD